MYISKYADQAHQVLMQKEEYYEDLIEEFLSECTDIDSTTDYDDLKIGYWDFANSLNNYLTCKGSSIFIQVEPTISKINYTLDMNLEFTEEEFILQDITYLNSRLYTSLLLSDEKSSEIIKLASGLFGKVFDDIKKDCCDNWEKDVFSEALLDLWSSELLRRTIDGDFPYVLDFAEKIEKYHDLTASNLVESKVILLCKELALGAKSGLAKRIYESLEDSWHRSISKKEYWGVPNYIIYLVRYIYNYCVCDVLPIKRTI